MIGQYVAWIVRLHVPDIELSRTGQEEEVEQEAAGTEKGKSITFLSYGLCAEHHVRKNRCPRPSHVSFAIMRTL